MKDEHASGYDFVQLGEGLADTLLRAAEDQVAQAQTMLDQTKSLTDIIRNQVKAQAEQIAAKKVLFKEFGETMLDAHRKLNGGELPVAADKIEPIRASEEGVRRLHRLQKEREDAIHQLQARANPAG